MLRDALTLQTTHGRVGAGGNLNSDPRQSGILVQRSPIAWHRIVYRGSIVPHSDPVILCVIFKLPGRCECTPRRIQKDISENARGHAARARGGSSASSSGATAQLPPYSIFLIVFSSLPCDMILHSSAEISMVINSSSSSIVVIPCLYSFLWGSVLCNLEIK